MGVNAAVAGVAGDDQAHRRGVKARRHSRIGPPGVHGYKLVTLIRNPINRYGRLQAPKRM